MLNRLKWVSKKLKSSASSGTHGYDRIYSIISQSEFFSPEYYIDEYSDLSSEEVDPARHYIDHGAAELRNPSLHFNTRFYSEAYPDVAASGMNPLLHYIEVGRPQGRWGSHQQAIKESGLFDPTFYLLNNQGVGQSELSPVDHYIAFGWSECRNPSPDFDLIWYAQMYMGNEWTIDPLLHYMNEGAQKGYLTRPPLPITFRPPTTYEGHATAPRRICLFAGYDPDGLIDPTVVEYISDLARHADVYYLADCHISSIELAKLHHVTKGAWAERHGRYDFGSWSILAQKSVGWDIIDDYDELILANDSCFLMRTLESVFTEMDGRDCDWWGLQATKGLAATFDTQALPGEVDLDVLKREWLPRFENEATYDFLVGSYFLVLRKAAHTDLHVRNLLNHVSDENSKIIIIRKYEIGLTRLLISLGYNFDTFIKKVYPHQPIYTNTGFSLIEQGFPLLKKYHLVENHYRIPNLRHWTHNVRKAGITKSLVKYEDNLRRTGDASKIYNNHDIEIFELAPPRQKSELVSLDKSTPKYDDWWAFPVCSHSHLFNDNIRAMFEQVKSDPKIKKIVLTRSKPVDLDGTNVAVFPLHSREGQFHLLRSRHIFLKHGVRSNLDVELSPELHCFHNLWHGIPLKRIGYASLDSQGRLESMAKQNSLLTSVIAASKVDQNAMATAYWPLTINDIWLTGLPRHDLITKPEELLPEDMKAQLSRLRAMLKGKKLILFAPTFRHDQENGYYNFTDEERDALRSILKRNGYVMGIREHMADRARQYTSNLNGDEFLAVPESIFPCVEILMRETHIVATDYSSTFVDFLLTGRPVISFAYDYEHYVESERGLFYNLEWSFPGIIANTFDEFLSAISRSMAGMTDAESAAYDQRRRLFIEYHDDHNSARVVERVNALEKIDRTIFDIQKSIFNKHPSNTILWIHDSYSECSAQHRIFSIIPEIEAMGWKSKIVTSDQLSTDHMTAADVAVFCNVPGTDQILDMAEGFRRSGKKVIIDIDEPLFSSELLEQSEYYQAYPGNQPDMRLRGLNVRRLMACAHLITASTPALVRLIEAKGMDAACIPSSLNSTLISRYTRPNPRQTAYRDTVIRVCYRAKTKTNAPDFEIMRHAANRILATRDNVEFHIIDAATNEVGENSRLLQGWICHPHLSYGAIHDFLDGMDINLAPLMLDGYNDYKSEIELAEAGLHAVPTIASPSAAYTAFIRHGANGFIARTTDEWHQTLLALILDDKLRQRVGQAARDTSIRRYSAASLADKYTTLVLK